MKVRSIIIYALLPAFVFCTISVKAQLPTADSLLIRAMETDELLPMLIDSAIKNSPFIRRMTNSVAYASENLEINKKNIFSSFSLNSSYNYGTNYSAINNSTGTSLNNFTTSQNGFYNLGVGLQLPLTNIISRKNLVRAGEAQVKMASAEKDNAALYVKQEVIRLYQEFKLAVKLLVISGSNKQSAQINFMMAEKEFLKGQSSIEQETRVLDIYNKAVIDYETYINRFQTGYMQLESYTGTSFSTLIKKMK